MFFHFDQAPGPTEVLPDIMDPRLVQKTVRIFLSSTFTDTRVDRNELMQEVFEPIRDLCQQHGIAFEVVDLRWGRIIDSSFPASVVL